jgi:hypothetical protein
MSVLDVRSLASMSLSFSALAQLNAPLQEESMDSNKNLDKEVAHILQLADERIEAQEWIAANTLLKKGLAILGNHYYLSDAADDTGTKLVLADFEEREGNLEMAARIRRRMLESRHNLFKIKMNRPR